MHQLVESPIVGRTYLVPCVKWDYLGGPLQWWPVIGPIHDDVEFLNFDKLHYHVDPRFFTKSNDRVVNRNFYVDEWSHTTTTDAYLQALPLCQRSDNVCEDPGMTRMLPRLCRREMPAFQHHNKRPVQKIADHYAGQRCGGKPGAWVCPHRGAPLASVPARDGVIECPLHGLRISAATGTVLPRSGQGRLL